MSASAGNILWDAVSWRWSQPVFLRLSDGNVHICCAWETTLLEKPLGRLGLPNKRGPGTLSALSLYKPKRSWMFRFLSTLHAARVMFKLLGVGPVPWLVDARRPVGQGFNGSDKPRMLAKLGGGSGGVPTGTFVLAVK